jgi:hypothetical protein
LFYFFIVTLYKYREGRGVRSCVVGKNKIVTLTMRVNAHDVSLFWQDDASGKFVMS